MVPVVQPQVSLRQKLTVIAVVVLVTAFVVGAGYWRTHPGVIAAAGGIESTYPVALPGQPTSWGAGIVAESGGTPVRVKLIKVVPVIAENGAAATVTLTLCESNAAKSGYNGSGGQWSTPISQICSTVGAVDGSTTYLGYDLPNILVTITPHRVGGTVKVLGLKITYQHGWQRGTVTTGPSWTVSIPAFG